MYVYVMLNVVHETIKTANYRGCPTHPDNGSSAGVTSLGKLLLVVAALTEDALLLKDKHGVLQLFVTTGADKVLRMPGATHGCGKGSSGEKEGGREGGKERERERGRKRGREGGREREGERGREREGEREAIIKGISLYSTVFIITANSPKCTK